MLIWIGAYLVLKKSYGKSGLEYGMLLVLFSMFLKTMVTPGVYQKEYSIGFGMIVAFSMFKRKMESLGISDE